jgi:mRNA interferase MazF
VEVKRGDVVLIVAPGELGKPRPAIVIQADALGDETTTLLICPLTSDLTEKLPVRPLIDPQAGNGLRIRSQVMTDKIMALRRNRIRAVVGSLDAEATERIDRALMVVLGLVR